VPGFFVSAKLTRKQELYMIAAKFYVFWGCYLSALIWTYHFTNLMCPNNYHKQSDCVRRYTIFFGNQVDNHMI